MKTNHQMNYYDYAKTLSAEGVMTALIGGGVEPEPQPTPTPWPEGWAKAIHILSSDGQIDGTITLVLDKALAENQELEQIFRKSDDMPLWDNLEVTKVSETVYQAQSYLEVEEGQIMKIMFGIPGVSDYYQELPITIGA